MWNIERLNALFDIDGPKFIEITEKDYTPSSIHSWEGKSHTEETKELLRQISLNMSQEHRDKISCANKGRKLSESDCQRKKEFNLKNGIKPPVYQGTSFRLTYEDGSCKDVVNLSKWCKDNDHSFGAMRNIQRGTNKKSKTYKGIVKVERIKVSNLETSPIV